MIEVQKLELPEVVPQCVVDSWLRSGPSQISKDCPVEVQQFIDAVAKNLPVFGRIGQFNTKITGYELRLCNMTEFNGEPVYDWAIYNLPVPHMVICDHHSAMHRAYRKRGKQGLIDYIKAKCDPAELPKLMEVLNVHVFHQESEEFKKVMSEINGKGV